ncbi:MAG: hypothetical protein QXU42_06880 [Thermoproteota archaeon]
MNKRNIWSLSFLLLISVNFLIPSPVSAQSNEKPHNEEELYYDKGVADYGFVAWVGGIAAVRFVLPEYEARQILKLKYFCWGEMKAVRIEVLDSKFNILFSREVVPTPGWFEVDISNVKLIVNGSFYIGWEWISDCSNGPWLGFDVTPPNYNESYVGGPPGTPPTLHPNDDYMIRAIVRTPYYNITFDTDPRLSPLVVDGSTYLPSQLPLSFKWPHGSLHTFSTMPTIPITEGKRLVFLRWSDGSNSNTRNIRIFNNGSYLAYFKTQYYLTVTTNISGVFIPGSGWYDAETPVAISVQSIVESQPGKRYFFSQWSDGSFEANRSIYLTAPSTYIALYKTQYKLTILSEYGVPNGAGWYDENTIAYASIGSREVDIGFPYVAVFVGWSGDATGTDLLSNPILMDRAKVVIAIWDKKISFLAYALSGIGLVLLVSLTLIIVIKSRRRKAK